MKIKFSILLIIVLFSLGSLAQKKKIPCPEILNQPNFYNAQTNTLSPLKKTVAVYKTKTKAFGLGGLSKVYSLDGNKAEFRVDDRDSIFLIVKLGEGMGDPSVWYTLYRAVVSKGKRTVTDISTQTFGNKTESGKESISYHLKSLGNNCFQIIPDEKLGKGEYFLLNKGTMNDSQTAADSFAFGID